MCKFKTADFYYGAALSMLLNHGITPKLFENTANRRIYRVTTDNSKFNLLLKYRSNKYINSGNYSGWSFSVTEDKDLLEDYIKKGEKFYVALICGDDNPSDSRLVFLDPNDVQQLFANNKSTFAITIRKGERFFRIPKNNRRDEGIKIKCDRFAELL